MNREQRTEAKRVPVQDGTQLTIDVLRWHEAWDFDCPVCVLRPVIRYSPNGEEADQMVEDLCITASVDGFMLCEGTEDGLIDRQFPFAALKRRWSMARRGREFPVKDYQASRFAVRFFAGATGELEFDMKEDVTQ